MTYPTTNSSSAFLPKAISTSSLTNYKKLINQGYDLAQNRLNNAQGEAQRSALENSQRQGAIQGTSGAGFAGKIQQKAVSEATKPYLDQSTALTSDKANALIAAGQASDQSKLQANTYNLARYTAANEMDLNKLATFINSSTALKNSGLDDPNAWADLFSSGVFQGLNQNAGIGTPTISPNTLTTQQGLDNTLMYGQRSYT